MGHLGAEHRSQGQFDEAGTGPLKAGTPANINTGGRRLANVRYGYACHHYNAQDPKFTTPYNWQHCTGMHVGETYEVHWPHSAIGACHTPHQFQTPFYDGVFVVGPMLWRNLSLKTLKILSMQWVFKHKSSQSSTMKATTTPTSCLAPLLTEQCGAMLPHIPARPLAQAATTKNVQNTHPSLGRLTESAISFRRPPLTRCAQI